ncbi:unnamed protein product, partial [Polarella glacialis]
AACAKGAAALRAASATAKPSAARDKSNNNNKNNNNNNNKDNNNNSSAAGDKRNVEGPQPADAAPSVEGPQPADAAPSVEEPRLSPSVTGSNGLQNVEYPCTSFVPHPIPAVQGFGASREKCRLALSQVVHNEVFQLQSWLLAAAGPGGGPEPCLRAAVSTLQAILMASKKACDEAAQLSLLWIVPAKHLRQEIQAVSHAAKLQERRKALQREIREVDSRTVLMSRLESCIQNGRAEEADLRESVRVGGAGAAAADVERKVNEVTRRAHALASLLGGCS